MTTKPNVVTFRQTLNVTWKRWEAPKRLLPITETVEGESTEKEVWRKIGNVHALITKKDGIAMALWRLKIRMSKFKDEQDRLIWNATMSARKRTTIGKNTYSVWTLTCTRRKYDMSGAD